MHVLLKGVVDFSKEVARLEKEAAGVQGRLDKLRGKMAMDSYAAKCPAATQVHRRPSAPFQLAPSCVRPYPMQLFDPPNAARGRWWTPARLVGAI